MDDTQVILASLRDAVRAQTAGLIQLAASQAVQTEMLRQILSAATEEPSDLIPALFSQMRAVAEGLEGLRAAVAGLRADLRAVQAAS